MKPNAATPFEKCSWNGSTKVPGVVYGVTSAAAGGDLLFAETCIELNLPIRVFLPLPKEQFRDDFDEPSWARAECVFKKALSVEVTGAGEKLTERYYECGIETVQAEPVAHRAVGRRTQPGIGRHGGHGPLRQGTRAAGHLDPQRDRRGAAIQRESGNPERSGNALPERIARTRRPNARGLPSRSGERMVRQIG